MEKLVTLETKLYESAITRLEHLAEIHQVSLDAVVHKAISLYSYLVEAKIQYPKSSVKLIGIGKDPIDVPATLPLDKG